MSVNGRASSRRTATLAAASLLGGLVALGGGGAHRRPGRRHDHRGEDFPCPHRRRPGRGRQAGSASARSTRAPPPVSSRSPRRTTPVQDTPSLSPFDAPQRRRQQALGSGFVIDKAGHIVTNYHVIEGADQIEVSFSNQDTLRATIVGSDPSTDIAVLRVEASSRSLTPLVLGNSGVVRVGDPVVAIGNPFGLARTATAGIVSAVQERTITAPNGYPIDHVIQTDAPINSGNSGGPLLNDRAQVIGVNSQIAPAQGSSGNVGIGFAVPSNTVKEVVAQLVATGQVDRAYLGIGGSHRQRRARARLPAPRRRRRARRGTSATAPRGACGLKAGTHVDCRRGRGLHARRRPDRRGRRQARLLARGAAGRARRPQARRDREARRSTAAPAADAGRHARAAAFVAQG